MENFKNIKKYFILLIITSIFIFVAKAYLIKYEKYDNDKFVTYVVNLKKQNLKLYWKNENQEIFRSIQNLKSWLGSKNQTLEFAMNAGMYKQDNSPQGLYIENIKIITPIDTASGIGNFYLKPNGIFYINTDNTATICTTTDFKYNKNIKYATQSGPMLLINNEIHSAFIKGSKNLNIRNGVGILPNNNVVFVMSKDVINLYDFANYIKSLGCKNALYLDGFVSRTYLPQYKWIQTDGNFGVMIGVVK